MKKFEENATAPASTAKFVPQYKNVTDHNGKVVGARMVNADQMPPASSARASTAASEQAGADERALFEAKIRELSNGEPDFASPAAMWAWAAWQASALTHRVTTAPSKDVQTTSKTAVDRKGSMASASDDDIKAIAIDYAQFIGGDVYDVTKYDCAEDFFNCVRACVNAFSRAADQQDAAQAQAGDDARDAGRYRWLRDKARDATDKAPIVVMMDWRGKIVRDVADDGLRSNEELDEAVDAAQAAPATSGGENG